MSQIHKPEPVDSAGTVLHWYDFICPFCYVGQQRNEILSRHGLRVVEMAFRAHPDIPPVGIPAGLRQGPMYTMLEREAKDAGLPLRWPRRLPNTRLALGAAEWVRRHQPGGLSQFHRELFEAHFVLGEDLEDTAVIDRHARNCDIDLIALHAAIEDSSAANFVIETEMIGRKYGVQGTPAWLTAQRLITGLRPTPEFEHLAEYILQVPN